MNFVILDTHLLKPLRAKGITLWSIHDKQGKLFGVKNSNTPSVDIRRQFKKIIGDKLGIQIDSIAVSDFTEKDHPCVRIRFKRNESGRPRKSPRKFLEGYAKDNLKLIEIPQAA